MYRLVPICVPYLIECLLRYQMSLKLGPYHIGLIGISNRPPLELGCVPKDQPSIPSVCELAQLRVDHRSFELTNNLVCRHRSAVYATSPQLIDLLQKRTTATLHASGIDTRETMILECQIKHTRRTQTEGIQPHN